MGRLRNSAEWQFNYNVGLHTAKEFHISIVEKALAALSEWIEGPVFVSISDLSTERVTYDAFSNSHADFKTAEAFDPADPKFIDLIRSFVPRLLEAKLRNSRRIVALSPFVHEDDSLTLLLTISLVEEEAVTYLDVEDLISSKEGERLLLRFLDSTNAFWVQFGVEAYTPSVTEVLRGSELPPHHCAYYGSDLVKILGKKRLRAALRGCPRLFDLSCGGIYFDWGAVPGESQVAQRVVRLVVSSLRSRRRVTLGRGSETRTA